MRTVKLTATLVTGAFMKIIGQRMEVRRIWQRGKKEDGDKGSKIFDSQPKKSHLVEDTVTVVRSTS